MSEAGPELSVVCKSCGSEVSPYVTECPYCGTRLRKRAPKLERVGDEVRVREGRRERRRRRAAERRERLAFLADYPLTTIVAILAAAVLLVVERATSLTILDLGALDGDVGGEWWRYVTASFVVDDVGLLLACGIGLAIFLAGVERRVGTVAALLLVLGTGTLAMLGATAIDEGLGDGILVTAGPNGIALGALAAWLVIREYERRDDPDEEYDLLAVGVAAAVLLLLPLVDDAANAWVGIVGALVGAAGGFAAARGRR